MSALGQKPTFQAVRAMSASCQKRSSKQHSVPMFVVHVGRMRMVVFEPSMLMRMDMGFSEAVFGTVSMLVMLIMYVRMRVCHGLVGMGMFVAFR